MAKIRPDRGGRPSALPIEQCVLFLYSKRQDDERRAQWQSHAQLMAPPPSSCSVSMSDDSD